MTQTTLRDYLLTTEDAISSGRVNDALTNCQYILTHFPESLEAQRLLGEVFLAQGQLDEAQQTFDWVLTNDPENVIVYCDRALISEQMQEYDTALDCYQQAYELSRGNSEIRREFNALSEKVGQTGFIFSRAGLARLYMRGDLLPQAIQEWEVVLSVSPERLDARTGLLEALWREGLYDRVEQLASRILNDVPSCLKALLLLAHVTFAQNASKAHELLRQAALLDPDLIKAQELFSDFIAHSPKDPFLNLLQKAPSTFPTNEKSVETAATAHPVQSTNGTNGTNGTSSSQGSGHFADPLVSWSSLDNIIEPQQEYQPVQDASSFAGWSDTSTTDFGAWNTFGQPSAPPSANAHPGQPGNTTTPNVDASQAFAQQQPVPSQDGQHAEPWSSQAAAIEESSDALDVPVTQAQDDQQQQPWYHVDVFEEPSFDSWNDKEHTAQSSSGISWGSMEEQESENPAPPAWLDMLTKSDPHPSNALPPTVPVAKPIEQPKPVVPPVPTIEPKVELPLSWSDQIATSSTTNPPSLDGDEPFFFGPAWLKSLGAAEIESSLPADVAQNVPHPEAEEEGRPFALPAQPIVAEQPVREEHIPISEPEVEHIPSSIPEAEIGLTPDLLEAATTTAVATPTMPPATPMLAATQENVTFENWLDHAAQKLNQPQQNILTTLEELENDLRSRGFMPLQPGDLSSFAEGTSDEALSSALAQLGNHEPQPEPDAVPAQPIQQDTPVNTPIEPLWAAPLPLVQATPQLQPVLNQVNEQVLEQPSPTTPNHLDTLSTFVPQTAPAPFVKTPAEPVLADIAASTSFANAQPNPTPTIPPTPIAAIHADPLETELETTMKRPAIRLQSMHQRHTTQSAQQQPTVPRSQSGERSMPTRASEGGTGAPGYKERLLRGYQHQLAGSYDDAMQEYRVIIRNAPDLLGEVVSNMRALLKIAPRYSVGYRVLGDAYMRQGEYLQAMEAYNKALSMAKKAKN